MTQTALHKYNPWATYKHMTVLVYVYYSAEGYALLKFSAFITSPNGYDVCCCIIQVQKSFNGDVGTGCTMRKIVHGKQAYPLNNTIKDTTTIMRKA